MVPWHTIFFWFKGSCVSLTETGQPIMKFSGKKILIKTSVLWSSLTDHHIRTSIMHHFQVYYKVWSMFWKIIQPLVDTYKGVSLTPLGVGQPFSLRSLLLAKGNLWIVYIATMRPLCLSSHSPCYIDAHPHTKNNGLCTTSTISYFNHPWGCKSTTSSTFCCQNIETMRGYCWCLASQWST